MPTESGIAKERIDVTPISAQTIDTAIIAENVVAVVMIERVIVWLILRFTSSASLTLLPYLARFSRRRS